MSSIKTKIKKAIPLSVFKRITGNTTYACYYHVISDDCPPHYKHIIKFKNLQQFRNDIKILSAKYRFINFTDFLKNDYNKRNSLMLTFDDGYQELYTIVYPIIKELNIPAIFFITTDIIDNKSILYRNGVSLCIDKINGFSDIQLEANVFKELSKLLKVPINKSLIIKSILNIDYANRKLLDDLYCILNINIDNYLLKNSPYLTTEQIIKLNKDPLITIGAHTCTHRELHLAENKNIIKDEISKSAGIIKSITNKDFVPFAFPYTSEGVDADTIKEVINENNYIKAVFGEANPTKPVDLVVPRFAFDNPEIDVLEIIKDVYIKAAKNNYQ